MDGDGTSGWQRDLLSTCLCETQVADAYVLLAGTSQWRTLRFDPAELNPPNPPPPALSLEEASTYGSFFTIVLGV